MVIGAVTMVTAVAYVAKVRYGTDNYEDKQQGVRWKTTRTTDDNKEAKQGWQTRTEDNGLIHNNQHYVGMNFYFSAIFCHHHSPRLFVVNLSFFHHSFIVRSFIVRKFIFLSLLIVHSSFVHLSLFIYCLFIIVCSFIVCSFIVVHLLFIHHIFSFRQVNRNN